MIDRTIERLLFASRWLLAPIYLGLSLALVTLCVKFFAELYHSLSHVLVMSESDVVLSLLSLVDLSLVASLIVMVMFSGYENFVSKIDVRGHEDRPEWMGTVDFSGLKLKLIASIVAISGIALLKGFLEITDPAQAVDQDHLMWMVTIHLTFVGSGVILALMDFLTSKSGKKH